MGDKMNRQGLIQALENYTPQGHVEEMHVLQHLHLLKTVERAYWRDCFEPGHLTASAFLVSPDFNHIAMMKHPHLGLWMQAGGHADGDENTLGVAAKELEEEMGIVVGKTCTAYAEGILMDVDCHRIPANPKKNELRHIHFDIRHLFIATTMAPIVSPEGHEVKWFPVAEAQAFVAQDGGLCRALGKIASFAAGLDRAA